MVPVVCVDGSQAGEHKPLTGYSVIANHKGEVLSQYQGSQGAVYADIDLTQAPKDRKEATGVWAMYRVRRPELYKLISAKE